MGARLLLSAVTRLLGSSVIGLAVGLIVGSLREPPLGVLTGIVTAATVFVIVGWTVLWPMSPGRTRQVARREDFQPFIEELSVVAATLSGLVGIVVVLVLRHSESGEIAAAIALGGVFMTWAAVHLMYAARYAYLSDTNVSDETIRAVALRHCLLSYAFGTVILATTINLVAGFATG